MTNDTSSLNHDLSREPLRPDSSLTLKLANRLLERVFPGKRVVGIETLSGGLVNANFKLQMDGLNESFVLRFYARDPGACQKEIDIYELIGATVPVPEVIAARPEGSEVTGPFAVLRYVEGIPFRQLRRSRNGAAIASAAFEIGRTLAAIGRYQFEQPGWFGPGLRIGGRFIEGADSVARFVDLCLASANLQRRVTSELVTSLHDFAWQWSPRLAWLEQECRLVHSDFGARNVLVREVEGQWQVAAVIDWEFAFSGSPLFDAGNFLRYERSQQPLVEPHFSQGLLAGGGHLREEWRQLARVIDLGALCEMLTRDELPEDVEREIVQLVRATLEDRDPP
jgi:aminoglycoside phosphotransferase (APT) family kinase protein